MHEHAQLHEETKFCKSRGEAADDAYFSSCVADVEKEAQRQEKDTIVMYGMLESTDAPLCRALAVWGLAGDDIGVLSIHGTSIGAIVTL